MIYEVFRAIRAKLISDVSVAAITSTRVYAELPDSSAIFPYILMDWVDGGDANLTPADMLDVSVQVKCVATEAAAAQSAQKLIRDALHQQMLTMSDGWSVYAVTHTSVVYLVEQAEKRQFYHAGGTFRIRASK